METDALQYGVGAVLFQKGKDRGERYIDFAAKAFNKAQQNYSAGKELELVKERHRESHMGEKMLFEMLWADRFWWETMWRDCKRVAKGCIDCLRHNVGQAGFHLMSTVKADRPWDHIAMDFIGKLPASEKGFVFILIIVDVLTHFVVLRPLMRKDAKMVALELVNLFANFGVVKIIQSDNESTFVSELLEELRGLMGFKARRVMKYFPRQNGLVESYVGEVKRVMKKWLEGDPSGWEGFIPAIQMGLNDRVISRHRSCPFSLMFGRHMNMFEDYEEMGDDEWGEANVKAWAGSVEQLGQFVWDVIEEKGGEVGEGFARDGNKRGESAVRRSELKVGDLVLRKIQRPKKGSRKAGGCLTFLLHSTECSTETKGKEKEKGERANKVRFKTFFICSQRREREKREREEKTPMFE